MKKALFVILFILLCFPSFSHIHKEKCEHDWKLEKIKNNNRYWVCSQCGKRYIALDKAKLNLYLIYFLYIPAGICIITTTAIYISKSEKKKFLKDVEYLKNQIKAFADKQEDVVYKNKLLTLFQKEVRTKDELEELRYQYHGGLLRTVEERAMHRFDMNRKNYNKQRHRVNAYLPFTAFVITFVFMILIIKDFSVILLPFVLIVSMSAMLVAGIIGYKINLSLAKDYDIPETDPMVQEESFKMKTAITAGVISAVHSYRHTKKAVKEFVDVDNWKEMK